VHSRNVHASQVRNGLGGGGRWIRTLGPPSEGTTLFETALPPHARAPLASNASRRTSAPDFWPVVKLFTPDGGCTWLLTEIDPEDADIAFGLCDLGFGCPELGSVSLSELESVRGQLGLPIERDLYFAATKTLSAYVDEALAHGAIRA